MLADTYGLHRARTERNARNDRSPHRVTALFAFEKYKGNPVSTVHRRAVNSLLVGLLLAAAGAVAQAFPTRPITIICAQGAGSSIDIIARLVAHDLSEQLKVPVIVVNRPGANGMIGVESAAKAPPDGYTLVIGTNSSHAANVSLFRKLPYDPERDFVPVALLTRSPSLLVANPGVAFRTFPEFIAYARANPGKLAYGTANSTSLIIGESIKKLAGIDVVAVPYKSSPQGVNDVVAGQIPLMIVDSGSAIPHLKSGKLLGLATGIGSPVPILPDVPPVAATLPGFDISSWSGLFAPAGTAAAVVDKLATEIQRSLQKQDTRTRLEQRGLMIPAMTQAEFGIFIHAETGRWAKWVKELGIQPQ